LLLVDRKKAFVLGFNYTRLDVVKSRSLGLVTKKRTIVQNVFQLIEADHNRTEFTPTSPQVVVSPENARERLSAFIAKARRELLIYDEGVTADRMITLLKGRADAGVDIKVLGRLEKKWRDVPIRVERLKGKRLHVRAIVRDRRAAFVGSQRLRKLELDERREAGLIIKHPRQRQEDRRDVRCRLEGCNNRGARTFPQHNDGGATPACERVVVTGAIAPPPPCVRSRAAASR
jgi:phosphatidylserine/phosphatidylglycerophosphate/cardiolipin synthase-like enzyme